MAVLTKFANAHTAVTTGYTNPTNAYADDGSYATAAPGKNSNVDAYFGFPAFTTSDIPDGSTINSVKVEIQFNVSTTGSVAEQYVQVYNVTTAVGAEQSNTAEPTTDTLLSHTVTSGISLTNLRTADVARAYVRSRRGNSNTAVTFSIDYVTITVNYTPVYSLSVESGSFTLSGQAVGVKAARKLALSSGSLTLSGQAVEISKSGQGGDPAPFPHLGLLLESGGALNFSIDHGSFTLSGQTVDLDADRKLAVAHGSFTLSGQDSDLDADRKLVTAYGAFTLSGQDVDLDADRKLALVYGAFTLSGQSVGFGSSLILDAGSFTLSGQAVDLDADRKLALAHATFSFSGQATTLRVGRAVALANGSFSLTGQTTDLDADRKLTLTYGGLTLTGQAVTLVPPSSGASGGDPAPFPHLGLVLQDAGESLTVDAGSFLLSGQASGLRAARKLSLASGAFTLTGQDVNDAPIGVAAGTGSFTLSGQSAQLFGPLLFNAATENIRTGTGSPTTFSHAGAASGVRGVLVSLVHGASATDHISAVSYGGLPLTRVIRATDTVTEPGAAEWWFRGTSVPQGTQTVSYTSGATTDDIHAVCITVKGSADLVVIATGSVEQNQANPSVTLNYNGRKGLAFAALYGGNAAPTAFVPNANCQTVHDHDLGAFYSEVIRQTTAGTANFAIGGTAVSDDVAFAALAIGERQIQQEITAQVGSFTLSGQAAVFRRGYSLSAGTGSFATSGSVTLRHASKVTAGTGSFTLSGQALIFGARGSSGHPAPFPHLGLLLAPLDGQYRFNAEVGTFTLNGQDVALSVPTTFAIDVGTFTLTGMDADRDFSMSAGVGSYTLSGQDTQPDQTLSFPAESGHFVLSGQNVTLRSLRVYSFPAGTGTYTLTGRAAGLRHGRKVQAAHGSFTLSGQVVDLDADRKLAISRGTYTLTGFSVGLKEGLSLSAGTGTFTLTGQDAPLYAELESLFLEPGIFSATFQDATLKPFRMPIDYGAFNLNGIDASIYTAERRDAMLGGGIGRTDRSRFKDYLWRKGLRHYRFPLEAGQFALKGRTVEFRRTERHDPFHISSEIRRPLLRLPAKTKAPAPTVDIDALIAAELKYAEELQAQKRKRRRKQDDEILLLM